jgi:alpha-glucosidase (family GH31 glycosyl hydrolase)
MADNYDPVASPQATVVVGHARFTVLTPQMIRMEWAADGKFEDRASFVFLNRNLPVPPFTHTLHNGLLTLQTTALTLTYAPPAGGDGRFTDSDLQIRLSVNGRATDWRPGMPNPGNLLGTTRTLDGSHGSHTMEPIGQGLISRDGWTLVDDSTRPLFDSANFSFAEGEQSPWPWVVLRPSGPRQDWYFFGYGHDYRRALADYVKVAGRIPIPPRFVFGNWWSRYWAYSDQELNALVRGFRQNDTPLSVLVIDMDWHKTFDLSWWKPRQDASGHTLGWSGYTWNPLLFPDPKAFLAGIHRQGLHVALNLHPASGIQPWDTHFAAMARAMGMNPATAKYVPFDITDKKFASSYFRIMLHPMERDGVDVWWLDWQQENHTALPGVNPTWWIGYTYFSDQAREGKRPMTMNRWGGLGGHRYPIGFSGDTISDWAGLAFQPWFTATSANVGFAYWSHDIGGHIPGAVSPELYTRWLQFGIFSPVLRTHTTKNPEAERRIWAYPEPYSSIMRRTIHLRSALEPYIYTEARRTYDTGVAFLHPLYYDWPEQEDAYTAKSEYMFGENLLVAPVTRPVASDSQLAFERVWLPPGAWTEWETGKRFTGPAWVDREFSIDQIPVYVRHGAILPMAQPPDHLGQAPLDPLVLTIFPLDDGQSSRYTLYQDAGDTRDYQEGQAAWTAISAMQHAGNLEVDIAAPRGTYPGMLSAHAVVLRLPGDWPPAAVLVNGHQVPYNAQSGSAGWRFEGNTLTTVITLPKQPVSAPLHIVVRRSPAWIARRAELDGFAGAMTRLREAYDTLNQTFPLAWSPDSLTDAMQTGDRLTYRPQTAQAELEHLRAVLPHAIADVSAMRNAISAGDQAKIGRMLGSHWTQEIATHMADYNHQVSRAAAQLADVAAATPETK